MFLLKGLNRMFDSFFWVKGHSNNLYNERCDRLAVEASKNKDLYEDLGYE